jgi:hypothetical protein
MHNYTLKIDIAFNFTREKTVLPCLKKNHVIRLKIYLKKTSRFTLFGMSMTACGYACGYQLE